MGIFGDNLFLVTVEGICLLKEILLKTIQVRFASQTQPQVFLSEKITLKDKALHEVMGDTWFR